MSTKQKKGIVITNARMIDGTGKDPVENSAIFIQGERIESINTMDALDGRSLEDYFEIDVKGKTVLPGLIEGHYHISYTDVLELSDLDLKLPPEECTVLAAQNGELILRCGYTSVFSAGALHRVDVALRDLIEAGRMVGPRLLASGRDICPTSGMLDWNPSYWKLGMDGLAIFADGVDEVRKAAREIMRDRANMIKIYLTGEGLLRPWMPQEETMMTKEEVAAVTDEARRRNRMVMAHSRGADGVKICVETGVDVIHHATLADQEAIDMIIANKEKHFVVPALGLTWATAKNAADCGVPEAVVKAGFYQEEYDEGCKVMKKLKDGGVRVLPGGDYGFAWCPHGNEAKDLELFVNDMGFTPMETLVAATKWGSEIMRMEDDVGTLEVGKYADVLVVEGDPLKDITLFQDRSNIQMVMKGGDIMCNQLGLPQMLTPEHTIEEHRARVEETLGYKPGSLGNPEVSESALQKKRNEMFAQLLART
jgi:imidazolonepropionase-like amidohydrolase